MWSLRVLKRTTPALCAPLSVFHYQKEGFVFTNKPKIHAGTFLHGSLLVTKIPHLRIKPVITPRQPGILRPLLGNRILQRPNLRKAPLPDPQSNLQQENQHYQNGPKRFHAKSAQKITRFIERVEGQV